MVGEGLLAREQHHEADDPLHLRHDDAVPELGGVEDGPRELDVPVELGRGRVDGVGLRQVLLLALGAW